MVAASMQQRRVCRLALPVRALLQATGGCSPDSTDTKVDPTLTQPMTTVLSSAADLDSGGGGRSAPGQTADKLTCIHG
jgi:hypothetical protein